MIQAYNFLASWQLFPEKGTYEFGERPKSGIYKIEAGENKKELSISHSWVTLENHAYTAESSVLADGGLHPFLDHQLADELHFYKSGQVVLHMVHEIQPNGYLKITQQGFRLDGIPYTNAEIYHKQMSVLPYAAS